MSKLLFIMSFIIPGSGQLVNKQISKGLLGLLYSAFSLFFIIFAIIPNFVKIAVYHTEGENEGAYTIGAVPYDDDSFLILVGFVFSIIFLLLLIAGAFLFARDAYVTRNAIINGETIVSLREKTKAIAPDLIPHAITLPFYILMFMFMLIPAIISIIIAFTNYEDPILPPAFLIEWSGFDNFVALFSDPMLSSAFTDTLTWTIVWTISSTMLVLSLGIFLAVVANNKKIKGKKFFRTIFLLPWAIPAFLTILIFQIFFSKVGTMNTFIMPLLTGQEYTIENAIGFLIDPTLAKITIILIQGWLGFPYVFILVTGVLQAIPEDLYEAANMDGGNPWSNFWNITFPAIIVAAAPLLITQFTFQFNNVTIFYLLGEAVVKPVGANYSPVETIASLGYQLTLDAEYATASVFALITSIFVSTFVLFSWIKTGAFKNEEVY